MGNPRQGLGYAGTDDSGFGLAGCFGQSLNVIDHRGKQKA
jgi:hypothetical protein